MSIRSGGGANGDGQPAHFEFNAEMRAAADKIIAKYPAGRQASAVIPLLDLAQRQHGGWLPRAAMDHVATVLGMAPIRVYEVATFYTMFNLNRTGRYHVQVCTTTPCWLRGSDAVMKACQEAADGTTFSVQEVECLGGCVNAPVVQINDDFYEDLDGPATEALLDALRDGQPPPPGSVIGRGGSAPINGKTTLTEPVSDGAGADDAG